MTSTSTYGHGQAAAAAPADHGPREAGRESVKKYVCTWEGCNRRFERQVRAPPVPVPAPSILTPRPRQNALDVTIPPPFPVRDSPRVADTHEHTPRPEACVPPPARDASHRSPAPQRSRAPCRPAARASTCAPTCAATCSPTKSSLRTTPAALPRTTPAPTVTPGTRPRPRRRSTPLRPLITTRRPADPEPKPMGAGSPSRLDGPFLKFLSVQCIALVPVYYPCTFIVLVFM